MLEEVLATFRAMPEEEVPSMIDLGYQLTVYAEEPTRSISSPAMSNHLLGFNELQDQIYGLFVVSAVARSGPLRAFWRAIQEGGAL